METIPNISDDLSFCRDTSVVNAIYSQSIVNVDGTIENRTQIANPTSSLRSQQISQEREDSSNVGQLLRNNRQGQMVLEYFYILNLHMNKYKTLFEFDNA